MFVYFNFFNIYYLYYMNFVEITPDEEKILYKFYNITNCPSRLYVNDRRVWWVPKITWAKWLHNINNSSVSFIDISICQFCFHHNNTVIKQNYVPIMVSNKLYFNCDMADYTKISNILLTNGWFIGFLTIDNSNNLTNSTGSTGLCNINMLDAVLHDNIITVTIPNNNIQIIIYLHKNDTTQFIENNIYKFNLIKTTNGLLLGSITICDINCVCDITIDNIKSVDHNSNIINKKIIIDNIYSKLKLSCQSCIINKNDDIVLKIINLYNQNTITNFNYDIVFVNNKFNIDFSNVNIVNLFVPIFKTNGLTFNV